MNINNLDVFVNDSNIIESQKKFKNINDLAIELSNGVNELYKIVSETTEWKGNGKELCEEYLTSITYSASVISSSASKLAQQFCAPTHWSDVSEAIDSFEEKSETFEKNSTLDCIVKLRNIMEEI